VTTETYTIPDPYDVSGIGPYAVNHEYDEGSMTAVVDLDGVLTELGTEDFSMSPVASEASGDLYLTASAAEAFDGGKIYIIRDTLIEQGWVGIRGQREKSLEQQVDRIARGLQEVKSHLSRTLRLSPNLPKIDFWSAPAEDRAGHVLIFDDAGNPVLGPGSDDIADAEANAKRAEIAAYSAAAYAQDIIDIRYFGDIGTDDDSAVFQAAVDAAEGAAGELRINGSINLRSHVFLGNVHLVCGPSAEINVIVDDDTAGEMPGVARSVRGLILSKATDGSPYTGYDPIDFSWSGTLRINFRRDIARSDSQKIGASMVVESCASFVGEGPLVETIVRDASVDPSGPNLVGGDPAKLHNNMCAGVDFYGATGRMSFPYWVRFVDNNAGYGVGSIRSLDESAPMENVDIPSLYAVSNQKDEVFALYNSSDSGFSGNIRNVKLGSVFTHFYGASSCKAFAVLDNSGSPSDDRFKGISVGPVAVSGGSTVPPSEPQIKIISFSQCAPYVESISGVLDLVVTDASVENTGTWRLVSSDPKNMPGTERPVVSKVDLTITTEITGVTPPSFAKALDGEMTIEHLENLTLTSGHWRQGLSGCTVLRGDLGADVYSVAAVDDCPVVGCDVEGVIRDCGVFTGKHTINSDNHPSQTGWFYCQSAYARGYAEYTPRLVEVTGSSAVGNIVNIQSSQANRVSVDYDITTALSASGDLYAAGNRPRSGVAMMNGSDRNKAAIVRSSNMVMDAEDMGYAYVTTAAASAVDFELPSGVAGMTVTVIKGNGQTVSITPQTGGKIGTAAVSASYTNSTSEYGVAVTLMALGANTWTVLSETGTWT
jgi:hypothetical protein